MRKSTTPNKAFRLNGGWRERLGNGSSKRFTPLGLFLMIFALFFTNSASAEIVTTTYDFKASIDANNTEVTMGSADADYTNCLYFTKIGNVSDPGRFAAQGTWILTEAHKQGLYSNNGGGRRFLVNNLYAGDVVIFDVVDVYGTSQTISLESTSTASANGNTFTMSAKGKLVVNLTRYWNIKSITIQHDDVAVWGYDPAVEVYDLYLSNTTFSTSAADFDLNVGTAQYLTNLSSGLALNNRVAISTTSDGSTWNWTFDYGLKAQYSWHNVSICNLVEGDRVRITWMGDATFSSKGQNGGYTGCAAFKDTQNNGDFIEGEDTYVSNGMALEAKSTRWDNNCNQNIYTSYFYTVTEDGHLDIGLNDGSRICKIEIYGDHQAQMVDEMINEGTHKSYFETTGMLEAKHHIVPGGLHVYVGNENDAQHAEVVRSDEGPVSYVYDQNHFKMARYPTYGNFNFGSELPATGTFYKFVPDVDGKMTIRFKAHSVNYRDFYNHEGNAAINSDGTPNEVSVSNACPYYLTQQNGTGQNTIWNTSKNNGATVKTNTMNVTAGQTYYLYGWWNNTSDAFNWQNGSACGVAELIDVTFEQNQYVYPLAKWVESNTTADADLATVSGYSSVFIKKKSDNIESCNAYIEGGKLKVNNITFKAGTNPGGVILIKLGDRNNDADPVFAYTIAYDAGFNEQVIGTDNNGNEFKRTEGYSWNFSDKSLKALQWNDRNAEADVVDFGTRFNGFASAAKDDNGVPTNGVNSGSFLSYEIDQKGDWTFNYRVKKNGTFYDPRFLNNYDMEGDNADMMWDTQGIIINAGSQQSCIFNEHGVDIDHSNKTQADPDRYVGFLEGGKFIIPKLKKDDRVIVYMGSGNGSGTTAMKFHITNALDALHNPIAATDDYWAGGSQWNVPDGHNDPYYRGCYHFFAADDGDMEFEMVGGSMCKLYSIQIYRGERIETNAVQGNNGYTLLAVKDQDGNVTSTETKTWNLHYRGKGEEVAVGAGDKAIVNEVIASSGNITNKTLGIARGGVNNSAIGISYTNQGEIGMLRVRVKCMEFNDNYVTDYSDRNLTLALHETKSYPYTWDFTDIHGFSADDIEAEYNAYPETTDDWITKGYDLSMWNEDGSSLIYGPSWGYVNQNMIFENSKGISGNQLYANGKVIPETQGLWWYFDNNDAAYNGVMQITDDGLKLANTADGLRRGWWNYKMVIPSVPAGAAVYLRASRVEEVPEEDVTFTNPAGTTITEPFFYRSYQFAHMSAKSVIGSDDNSKLYEANDGSGDYILAVYNSGAAGNLTLTLNGWVLKKMSVSLDKKTLDSNGWATESREHVIDPSLTAYLTGYDIETCFVQEIGYGKNGKSGQVGLIRADLSDNSAGQVIRAMANGDAGACLLHHTEGSPVEILDGGFHLFVPDMHDYEGDFTANTTGGIKTVTTTANGILKAQVGAGTIPATDDNYTNYILSNKRYVQDQGDLVESVEAFYRVKSTGAKSNGHNAYLQLETEKVQNPSANAFEIVFDLDHDADGINEVNASEAATTDGIYTINGQKLENMPAKSGLYIVNGKKTVIK